MNILKLSQIILDASRQGPKQLHADEFADRAPRPGNNKLGFQMSNHIKINQPVPDFSLTDVNGQTFQLSSLQGKANVLLVFNRGFT